jgi:hypothetical protein
VKLEEFVEQNGPKFIKLSTTSIIERLEKEGNFSIKEKGIYFEIVEKETKKETGLLKDKEGGFKNGIYWRWRLNESRNKIIFTPQVSADSRIINPLAEKIASLLGFEKMEIQAPEEIVFLPFPRWCELRVSGYAAQGHIESSPMFKSEAKEVVEEFIVLLHKY